MASEKQLRALKKARRAKAEKAGKKKSSRKSSKGRSQKRRQLDFAARVVGDLTSIDPITSGILNNIGWM